MVHYHMAGFSKRFMGAELSEASNDADMCGVKGSKAVVITECIMKLVTSIARGVLVDKVLKPAL